MKELIIYIITGVSASFIITREFIFEGLRDRWERLFFFSDKLKYLITCPVCLGFWVGLAASFLFPSVQWWWGGLAVSLACRLVQIWENSNNNIL